MKKLPLAICLVLLAAATAALAQPPAAPKRKASAPAAATPAARRGEAPRRLRHRRPRPQRRPVHELLRVRVRRLAQGEPDPGGPDALGTVQRARGEKPRGAAPDPRGGEGPEARTLADRGEGRRLLRRVHGRAGDRGEGPLAREAARRPRGRRRLEGRALPTPRPARGGGASRALPLRRLARHARLAADDRQRGPGRPRPARPRRLPERGREVEGEAREVRRARGARARARRRLARAGEGRRGDGHEGRDGARRRAPQARRDARPEEPRQPDDARGAAEARPGVRVERLPQRDRRALVHAPQRVEPEVLHRGQRRRRRDAARRLEDVRPLAPPRRRGAVPRRGLRDRGLPVEPGVPAGGEGDRAALEALRAGDRPRPRRRARRALRREDVRQGRQGAHGEDDRGDHRGDARGHRDARLDDPRDEAEGRRRSWRRSPRARSATPTSGRTTRRSRSRATTISATRDARGCSR